MVKHLDGTLRLVDNRILLGDSTFCQQPRTIAVLHPKEPCDAEALRLILELANSRPPIIIEGRAIPLPDGPKEVPARYRELPDDGNTEND